MQRLKGKNLLLIEDSDAFIEEAMALFGLFFKAVFVAKTTAEASQLLKSERIDLIVSDIHLARENALDFIARFRAEDTKTPVVVLSGHKDEPLLFQAMTLGLSGYLLKPVNYKQLTEVLTACSRKIAETESAVIKLDESLAYDRALKKAIKNGEAFVLNSREIRFFELLADRKDQVLTKEMFWEHVWQEEEMTLSALNNFVMRLRRRFGRDFLHTIPDVGYKLTL